jgi:DNA-binding transcriptional regulator YhcF (GntR family)
VARTYRELESAGLVVSRRGGGTRVQAGAAPSAAQRQRTLREHAEAFVRQARLLGLSDEDVRQGISDVLRPGRPVAAR